VSYNEIYNAPAGWLVRPPTHDELKELVSEMEFCRPDLCDWVSMLIGLKRRHRWFDPLEVACDNSPDGCERQHRVIIVGTRCKVDEHGWAWRLFGYSKMHLSGHFLRDGTFYRCDASSRVRLL
jgi:hypothetical protein